MVKQSPAQEHPSQIILDAVALHERQLGVGTLAFVLKGLKNKRILNRQLHTSRFFGSLFYKPLDVIENYAHQLVRQGFLCRVDIGSSYKVPLLELTPAGKQVLERRTDIPLQAIRTKKPVQLNETAKETIALFKELRSIQMVAEKRGLSSSTVWSHLTMGVQLGLIAPAEVVDKERLDLILSVHANLNSTRLKELKAALPEEVTYEEIQCAITSVDHG
ncbi:MAG: helix-turn-helix domain-containing protein [Nanoarchaeota archaeon]